MPADEPPPTGPLLSVRNLRKSYGGVRALHDLTWSIRPGEIHGLCGENGAGKSTLIRCLAGVTVPDAGSAIFCGRPLSWGSVRRSEADGIAVLHQESTIFPDLSALDNVFVGRAPTKFRELVLDRTRMRREAQALLHRLGVKFDLDSPLASLSVAQRQFVSLARALSHSCRLLIMDEPTASLSAHETAQLLSLCKQLQDDGLAILYVSHRLEEVFALTDRVTVLRDGKLVATEQTRKLDRTQLVEWMVGRTVEESAGSTRQWLPTESTSPPRFALRNFTGRGFRQVSLEVHAGEIVGLAGLVGAGRSEVARAAFGIDAYDTGEVQIDGRPLRGGSVQDALNVGLALVPEDRQHEGIILPLPVGTNLSLVVIRRLSRMGFIQRSRESSLVERLIEDLRVKVGCTSASAQTLSGGNQQKLVIGKWLASQPRILLLDEPTRGIDVAAKAQVQQLVRELAGNGMATLVISSDIGELKSLCHRIVVMAEGRVRGEVPASAPREAILSLALPAESSPVTPP